MQVKVIKVEYDKFISISRNETIETLLQKSLREFNIPQDNAAMYKLMNDNKELNNECLKMINNTYESMKKIRLIQRDSFTNANFNYDSTKSALLQSDEIFNRNKYNPNKDFKDQVLQSLHFMFQNNNRELYDIIRKQIIIHADRTINKVKEEHINNNQKIDSSIKNNNTTEHQFINCSDCYEVNIKGNRYREKNNPKCNLCKTCFEKTGKNRIFTVIRNPLKNNNTTINNSLTITNNNEDQYTSFSIDRLDNDSLIFYKFIAIDSYDFLS